jgi:hypothetical protein
MSITEAERKKDYHAGPGDSFPIGTAGQHLKAAWDLAGHASNPDEVRRHIIAFAREHGLVDHLPQAARDYMVQKATSATVSQLFHMAWHHESMEGDRPQQARLAQFAAQHGLAHLLPPDAHEVMHENGIAHVHSGIENDERGMHVHPIVKAFNPISKQGIIVKSWDAGNDVIIEGWLATDRPLDLEKDSTEPEAFIPAIDGYFSRRAPLSIEHEGKSLPVGHLQKAAIVRDGKIIKAAEHPTDAAEFEHFPGTGTGVWARARVNEEPGISAVRKGNVGGFSFIANATKYVPIPGGRYRYLEFDPWLESAIAAYPINPDAIIAVAKAFGLKEEEHMPQEPESMNLDQLLSLAVQAKAQQVQKATEPTITLSQLSDLFNQHTNKILEAVDQRVQKAFSELEYSREGIGRLGVKSEITMDDNPAEYIVRKASSGEELSVEDKELITELTFAAILDGLK